MYSTPHIFSSCLHTNYVVHVQLFTSLDVGCLFDEMRYLCGRSRSLKTSLRRLTEVFQKIPISELLMRHISQGMLAIICGKNFYTKLLRVSASITYQCSADTIQFKGVLIEPPNPSFGHKRENVMTQRFSPVANRTVLLCNTVVPTQW
jgi:hypothetical protein